MVPFSSAGKMSPAASCCGTTQSLARMRPAKPPTRNNCRHDYHTWTCCAAGFQTGLCRLGVKDGGYRVAALTPALLPISGRQSCLILPNQSGTGSFFRMRYARWVGCYARSPAPVGPLTLQDHRKTASKCYDWLWLVGVFSHDRERDKKLGGSPREIS